MVSNTIFFGKKIDSKLFKESRPWSTNAKLGTILCVQHIQIYVHICMHTYTFRYSCLNDSCVNTKYLNILSNYVYKISYIAKKKMFKTFNKIIFSKKNVPIVYTYAYCFKLWFIIVLMRYCLPSIIYIDFIPSVSFLQFIVFLHNPCGLCVSQNICNFLLSFNSIRD